MKNLPPIAQALHVHTASNGVTAVRTRDAMATLDTCRLLQQYRDKPIKIWDPVRGFLESDDPLMSNGDDTTKHIDAFKNILKIEEYDPDDETYPLNALYCFTMIHQQIQRSDPVTLQLFTLMAYRLPLSETDRRVVICVPPSFSLPSELQEIVPVVDHLAPNVSDLTIMVGRVLKDMEKESKKVIPKLSIDEKIRIAQSAAGMIIPEAEGAFSRVVSAAVLSKIEQTAEDLRRSLLSEKSNMVKRSVALEVMEAVDVSQVGGLEQLKSWIETRVPAMDSKAWEQGVDKPKGCALVGPPGTGKSLLGKVIGGVLGVATIRFNISAVFEGLVGSSEKNMREALFMLRSLAPCVVLLDEVDKVFSTGPTGDSGTSQKVFGELLTFMQEAEEPIFWVPTLNRVDDIPAEFLRAGRLDEVFGVATPSANEREEILRIHLRKRKVEVNSIGSLDEVIHKTKDFVGAEIENLAKAARLAAYNEEKPVNIDHLLAAARETKPLAEKMKDQFKAMEHWCNENARPANSPTPKSIKEIDHQRVDTESRRRRQAGLTDEQPKEAE